MVDKKSGYKPNYRRLYEDRVRSALQEELGLKNVMQVPRLKKIVLNMGVGEGSRDEKVLITAEKDLTAISVAAPAISTLSMRYNTPPTRGKLWLRLQCFRKW